MPAPAILKRVRRLPDRAAVLFFAAALLLTACAGGGRRSESETSLEGHLLRRRAAGTAALAGRIDELTRQEKLPDIRKFNAPAALAAAEGGIAVASAAWWGWRPAGATYALNEALSAPVDVLIVPAMPGPWVVGPLVADGPREILFEPGCVVLAAEREFLEAGDSLLSIVGQRGVALSGYGARLEMRKEDYARPPYESGQWRHGVAVLESSDVLIEGLSIRRSGGDGVYVGQRRNRPVSTGVVLRDLDIADNFRQGVSVIAAEGFRMEYSAVTGTRGNPPQAGIDFEPNSGVSGLVDCRVSRCVFRGNAGAAFQVHLSKMRPGGPPVSILVEDSFLIGSPLAVWIRGLPNGVAGAVELRNCAIQGLKTIGRSPGFSVAIR